MCRSSPRNSITFALLCAPRIGCGVRFEWETRQLDSLLSLLSLLFSPFFILPPPEVIRHSWRKIGEYSADKFAYPKFLDIRNCIHRRIVAQFIKLPRECLEFQACLSPRKSVARLNLSRQFRVPNLVQLNSQIRRLQFKLYPSPRNTDFPLGSGQHVPNEILSRTMSFSIRIFVSREIMHRYVARFPEKERRDNDWSSERKKKRGWMKNSSGERTNFEARNRCRNASSNQISNLLTGWNREELDEKTRRRVESVCLPPPPLSWSCVPKLTKHTHASSRQLSDEGESANLLDASRFESYRSRTGASAPSDPSEDLCCCRLFVFFATIVARIYWKVPLFFFFFLFIRRASRSPCRPCLSLKIRTKMNWYGSPLFNFRAREWPLVKNPRKRISVSIYIPDRHRPLLRGDEFNRRIPFTLVKSPGIGTTLSSFLSNISRGIFYNFSNNNKFRSSFPFLLLFSFLSPFVFSFFTHTARAVSFCIRLANNPAFKVSVTAVFNRSSIPTRYLLLPPLPLPSPQNLATLQTNARTRVVFVRAAWRIGCVRSSAIRDPCPIRPTNKVVPVTSNV